MDHTSLTKYWKVGLFLTWGVWFESPKEADESRTGIKLHPSAPIGYLQLIDGKQLDETILAEIFGNPAGEPEEPPRGTIREATREELTYLDDCINIQAPDPWATTYREMLSRRHQQGEV